MLIIRRMISFVVLCLTLNSARVESRKLSGHPVGFFKCPPDQVLTVYDHELPDALYMVCKQAKICNGIFSCSASPGTCPTADVNGLGFLHEVKEATKFETLTKACCTYDRPDAYVGTTCFPISITDQLNGNVNISFPPELADHLDIPPELLKPSPQAAKQPDSAQLPLPDSKVIEVMTSFLNGRNDPVLSNRKDAYAEVFLHPLRRKPEQILIVNDISRISNGYTISVCHVECSDTTSTTETETDAVATTPDQPIPERMKPVEVEYYEELSEVPDSLPEIEQIQEPCPDEVMQEEPEGKYGNIDIDLPLPSGIEEAPGGSGDVPEPLAALVGQANQPICFAQGSLLQTPDGPRPVEDVQTGQYVLISPWAEPYAEIQLWYHRLEDVEAEFIVIETDTKSISLSPNHLIPVFDCHDTVLQENDNIIKEAQFASRAKPGQCVVAIGDNGQPKLEVIMKVSLEVKKGIYSPITNTGTLVVDGIYVSCFASFEDHDMLHTIHTVFVQWHKFIHFFIGEKSTKFVVNIPYPLEILMYLANMILPEFIVSDIL